MSDSNSAGWNRVALIGLGAVAIILVHIHIPIDDCSLDRIPSTDNLAHCWN